MKKIIVEIFIILSLFEILILYNCNNRILLSNKRLENELQEKNLIENNNITLDSIYKEKEDLENKIKEEITGEDTLENLIAKEKETSESLKEEISTYEQKIVNLENSVANLESEYNRLMQIQIAKNTFLINGVPTINQYPIYPTGCESVALTILLNYYGVQVSPSEIIDSLDKESLIYYKDGIKYGGNPELGFIGDPRTQSGFGVYEKPIAKVADTYKPGIKIATGTSFEEILKVVKNNTPVLVWTSMNLSTPYISTSWTYEPTGETIYWKAGEHAVVIIGYTPDRVIISDPIGGTVKYQSRTLFEERYNYFGKKALYY